MSGVAESTRAWRCPICDTIDSSDPAFVATVPRSVNVLVTTRTAARAVPTGTLALHECTSCGFVGNAAFDGIPYDETYLVDPTASPRNRAHLDEVADVVLALGPSARGLRLAEVGAGRGQFLARLAARAGDRLVAALGVDPAYVSSTSTLPAHVRILGGRLEDRTDAARAFTADVVVTRHVIEHVPDPRAFLRTIVASFDSGSGFRIVVETPNLDHTLMRGHLHDFIYEHCSLFGPDALAHALRREGFVDVSVDARAYDGEYLIATATHPGRAAAASMAASTAPPLPFSPPRAPRLASHARRFVDVHRGDVERARADGPVVLWGGAGKGALVAWFVDPEGTRLAAVVDILPAKQGHHLPGAGHRVVSPAEARALGARTVIVANPTYHREVERQADEASLGARVVALRAIGSEPSVDATCTDADTRDG